MKKILSLLSLAALTVGLLGSCSKINERIDGLERRVDGIENEQIASVRTQVEKINSSIADLGTIRENISGLKTTTEAQAKEIAERKKAEEALGGRVDELEEQAETLDNQVEDLKEADIALGERIDELKNYIEGDMKDYARIEWVQATFSTLKQYEATCDTIAKIDVRIGALDAKLSKDIKDCADSLTRWVNKTFEGYYTAAEMDAALELMQADIDSAKAAGKITDAKADSIANELTKTKAAVDTAKANIRAEYKAAIETAIKTSEGKLTKKIQDEIATVNGTITALTGRVASLETSVAALSGDVDALKAMIQSVSITPAYSDGSVEAVNGILTLKCIVSPAKALSGIKSGTLKDSLWLYADSVKVKTKADASAYMEIKVSEASVLDADQGAITLTADISGYLPKGADKALTVAVNIRNGISNFTTEFVNVDNTSGYTVTFNNNYGTSPVTRDTSVLKGGKINKPADPTREGWFFDKWFTKNQAQGEVEWDFTAMTVSQDTTLYADWIQGKKVTFRKDTVNLTVCKDTLVRPNTKVTKPTDPDSTGYTLLGWYTKKQDGTFGDKWSFDNTNVTKDTTLYAKWAKTSMTIAELVATNSKFPVSNSDDVIPENVWLTANNDSCYFVTTGVHIRFINRTSASDPVVYTSTKISLTIQDDGSYQNEQGTLKFVMDCDSVVSITLNRTTSPTELNGTYAPKSSIPEGALAGVFTVADDGQGNVKKVYFSQGNLQATYSTSTSSYTWGFAAHQYSCIGNAAGNTTIANQTDVAVVDLFGWSTGSTTYGISASKNQSDYSGDFVDWGKNIGDGNTWSTLSKEEWTYLINNRSHKYSTVNGVNGLVIAPDGFNGTLSESYTDDAALAADNLVFLPATGSRYEDFVSGNSNGYYWSSTANGNDGAYNESFSSSSVYSTYSLRCNGYSVRLITEAK